VVWWNGCTCTQSQKLYLRPLDHHEHQFWSYIDSVWETLFSTEQQPQQQTRTSWRALEVDPAASTHPDRAAHDLATLDRSQNSLQVVHPDTFGPFNKYSNLAVCRRPSPFRIEIQS
jgi:hypothetical protein